MNDEYISDVSFTHPAQNRLFQNTERSPSPSRPKLLLIRPEIQECIHSLCHCKEYKCVTVYGGGDVQILPRHPNGKYIDVPPHRSGSRLLVQKAWWRTNPKLLLLYHLKSTCRQRFLIWSTHVDDICHNLGWIEDLDVFSNGTTALS